MQSLGFIAPLGRSSPLLTYKVSTDAEFGDIFHIEIRDSLCLGVFIAPCESANFECKQAIKANMQFLPHQKILARFIEQYYCCSFSQSFSLFTPLANADSHTRQVIKQDFTNLNALSSKQLQALHFTQNNQNTLLFGDTGSGKTEVYMHLIAQTLQTGKTALFLMPEISLTPQIEMRLKSVFGEQVGIWHSKINTKNKKEILAKLESNEIKIIAGARSALFLPMNNLGLIIVDEEHDDAYKSQSTPRYNTRDICLYLGKHSQIKVLLGSATPSLSTYSNAKKSQTLFRLKGRHFENNKSYIFSHHQPLSESMVQKIAQTLKNNQQVIVFLPTRAHFKTLFCQECAQSVQCAFCSVNMSLHLDKNALMCHYCGYTTIIPNQCPKCQGTNLQSRRIGTQEFTKELKQNLIDSAIYAKIGIFDRDSITTHTKLKSILKDFNARKLDILVGTQMLSKGHDYHNVALSVVVGIDYVLNMPDFRANERAMSLLEQIAGRAGRKENGEVFIQTLNEGFFKRFVDDYETFLEYELHTRPKCYPPFMRLANISFSHKVQQTSLQRMQQAQELLESYLANHKDSFEIVGAKASDIIKIGGKFRHNILLRTHSIKSLLSALRHISNTIRFPFEIDIDPLSTI